MARKDRKVLRNCGFRRFRGVKMLILVQNDETRSKLDKIRAGPTQIDPRGSNGPLKSENRSIYAGQVLKNPGWLSGDPTDIPKVAACVHFARPRAIARGKRPKRPSKWTVQFGGQPRRNQGRFHHEMENFLLE